jgi:probable addiction module antidote protein
MSKRFSKDDIKLAPFDTDVSKYLTDDEAIADYIDYILEEGDEKDFARALKNIAKAKGITSITQDTLYMLFKGLKNRQTKISRAS